MTTLEWTFCPFSELTTQQLYQLMKLRVDVFVVEQACVYPELDGKDTLRDTWHLLGCSGDTLVAYARIMGPAGPAASVTVGRVVTDAGFRGQGVARQLMVKVIELADELWPLRSVALSAQTQVTGFYQSLGFAVISEEYFEDGIPHVDMLKGETDDT